MSMSPQRQERLAASRQERAEAIARRRSAPSSLWLVFSEGGWDRAAGETINDYRQPVFQGFLDEDEARSFAVLNRCALVKLPVTEDYRGGPPS